MNCTGDKPGAQTINERHSVSQRHAHSPYVLDRPGTQTTTCAVMVSMLKVGLMILEVLCFLQATAFTPSSCDSTDDELFSPEAVIVIPGESEESPIVISSQLDTSDDDFDTVMKRAR